MTPECVRVGAKFVGKAQESSPHAEGKSGAPLCSCSAGVLAREWERETSQSWITPFGVIRTVEAEVHWLLCVRG